MSKQIEWGSKKINMVFSARGRILSFDREVHVSDPQTGQVWTWLETDQPGLFDFLGDFLHSWYPFVTTGHEFLQGRQPGTGGPIRKEIAKLLKKNRVLKPRELWQMLSDNKRRGWTFYARGDRRDWYIEGPRAQNMGYPRFSNVCREEARQAQKLTG